MTAVSVCRVLSRMSELDRQLTTAELSSYVAPFVASLLRCRERLGETRWSLDDDVDAVDRLTRCETSLAVECRRLLHGTATLLGTDGRSATLAVA